MNHQQDLMARGKCPDCADGVLQHGPWTKEQIQEVADDIGIPAEDFTDQCDDCFVQFTCFGDADYAQTLSPDRPLVLKQTIA